MTSYGSLLSSYRYDWLQGELVRPFRLSRTTSACRSTRPKRYCVSASPRFRMSRRSTATPSSPMSEGESGVSADRRGSRWCEAPRCGQRTLSGATEAARSCAKRAGITQTRADHDRLMVLLIFRSAGLHELLARFPEQVVLQRAASGPAGLLAVLRARGSGHHVVLPRAGPARHDARELRFPGLFAAGGAARRSRWNWCTSASGTCVSRSRIVIGAGVSSSPVMPRTVIRRMAATASTRASRMRRISAGNLQAELRGWAGTAAARFVR